MLGEYEKLTFLKCMKRNETYINKDILELIFKYYDNNYILKLPINSQKEELIKHDFKMKFIYEYNIKSDVFYRKEYIKYVVPLIKYYIQKQQLKEGSHIKFNVIVVEGSKHYIQPLFACYNKDEKQIIKFLNQSNIKFFKTPVIPTQKPI